MADAPTLTDGTVTIRAPRAADAQGFFEQCQDPLSQRWATVPVPYAMAHGNSTSVHAGTASTSSA